MFFEVLNSWYWNLYRTRLQSYFGTCNLASEVTNEVKRALIALGESRSRQRIVALWIAELKDFTGDSKAMMNACSDEIFSIDTMDDVEIRFNQFFLPGPDAAVLQQLIGEVGISLDDVNKVTPSFIGDDKLNYRPVVFGKASPFYLLKNLNALSVFCSITFSLTRGTCLNYDKTCKWEWWVVGGETAIPVLK